MKNNFLLTYLYLNIRFHIYIIITTFDLCGVQPYNEVIFNFLYYINTILSH